MSEPVIFFTNNRGGDYLTQIFTAQQIKLDSSRSPVVYNRAISVVLGTLIWTLWYENVSLVPIPIDMDGRIYEITVYFRPTLLRVRYDFFTSSSYTSLNIGKASEKLIFSPTRSFGVNCSARCKDRGIVSQWPRILSGSLFYSAKHLVRQRPKKKYQSRVLDMESQADLAIYIYMVFYRSHVHDSNLWLCAHCINCPMWMSFDGSCWIKFQI